ncbi:hypothetical protein [Actinomadura sp. 7K534]|uniref:hypothetical protein n=1 Tax=Actinomadura sp. 7K534 TaxID=2530366 RepID=UPI0010454045|nr:hypothetical protein [Actinomadura sp. 7K534]TDB95764.1 hypothetical protein E1266_12020 [Actinomadura sp. 7K534]
MEDLQAHMSESGWRDNGSGPAGSLWTKGDSTIAVPLEGSLSADLIYSAIERLAAHEQLEVKKLADMIRYRRVDRTELKAVNGQETSDSIPLDAAAAIVKEARRMLRASGTTALHERGDLKGNFSHQGDEVVHRTRMAHTLKGSFIIPILVPLSEVSEPESDQSAVIDIHRAAPEPFERRVTRTFAQAMQAVQDEIIQPAREPTIRTLHAVVERGVSREFCLGLSNVLAQRSVGEFGATFNWATTYRPPATMPDSIAIDSGGVELVQLAAEKLRVNPIEPKQTFSGTIVELRHVPDEPEGYVTISTVRNGRSCEIRVTLPAERYDETLAWHRSKRVIIVEGEVRRSARRLIIDSPVRCRPIDEVVLPGT